MKPETEGEPSPERPEPRDGSEDAAEMTDRPAAGVVATGEEPDLVAGAVLRARGEGYDALVATDSPDSEAADFARRLGASIVTFEPGEEPGQLLSEKARERGYPGLIQVEPGERPDLAGAAEELRRSESYAADAETLPVLEESTRLVAGIPAYCEEGSVGSVVRDVEPHVDEVLVVDDGSGDGTAEEAGEAGATVVRHGRNRGYGAALKTVFEEASKRDLDGLVVLDGDGQHDATDVPELFQALEETEADIVIGSRFVGGAKRHVPLYRRVGLFVVNSLTNLSLGVIRNRSWVNDTQSGFRAYGPDAIQTLSQDGTMGDNMGASTDILYHAHHNDLEIEEVGTVINYDVEDGSEHHPLNHGIHLVMNVVRTIERDRPIAFLGVPGLILTILGATLAYWTMVNYLNSGTFPLGIALTSTFFGLAGLFSGFTAIILHALNTNQE